MNCWKEELTVKGVSSEFSNFEEKRKELEDRGYHITYMASETKFTPRVDEFGKTIKESKPVETLCVIKAEKS